MGFNSAVSLVATIASAVMMYAQTSTVPAPPQAAKAGFTKLVLNEDFRNFDLRNQARSSVAWRFLGNSFSNGQISVSNGVLTLTASGLASHHGAVSSITTMAAMAEEPQHDFLFGYFEARLRLDWNPDNWDSFWLVSAAPVRLSRSDLQNDAVRYCEIDIMELQPTSSVYTGTVHDWHAGRRIGESSTRIQLPPGVSLSDWNTFGLLWQPGKVSWYLNDKLVSTQPSPPICDQDRLNPILQSAHGNGDEDQRLQVNWVHVYH
jgi:hypothetical protein